MGYLGMLPRGVWDITELSIHLFILLYIHICWQMIPSSGLQQSSARRSYPHIYHLFVVTPRLLVRSLIESLAKIKDTVSPILRYSAILRHSASSQPLKTGFPAVLVASIFAQTHYLQNSEAGPSDSDSGSRT